MDARISVVGVTANRPEKFPSPVNQYITETVIPQVLEQLARAGAQTLVHGACRGGDLWFAQEALQQGYDLTSLVPFPQQDVGWSNADSKLRQEILDASKEVVVLGRSPSVRLYHARNDEIVKRCDVLVALLGENVNTGGAATTLAKAMRIHKPVIEIRIGSSRVWHTKHNLERL